MSDEKKPNDPEGNGQPPVTPPDPKGSPTDTHWQKIAEDRRIELEKKQKELDDAKKSNEQSDYEKLKAELAEINKERAIDLLEKTYPDIEPVLLLGRTAEDQKAIVEKQRARATKFAETSIDVNAPQYTESEMSQQVESIKKTNQSPIAKAAAILRLNRLQRENS